MLSKLILVIIAIFCCWASIGQTLSERLILSDTQDSLFLKSDNVSFDKHGNYCFIIKKNQEEYFVTNNDTIGGFKFMGLIFNSDGAVNYTSSYFNENNVPFYYKNERGTKVYGLAVGRIRRYQTSGTKENIAITTTLNDTVFYYINNDLVHKALLKTVRNLTSANDNWVAFSENGNVIYYIQEDSLCKLFVNHKLIDSTKFSYTQLSINNEGKYIYANGRRSDITLEDSDFIFFINSPDSILGHVRTVWDFELNRNDAYYYSGLYNDKYYIVINDLLHKELDTVYDITLIDKNNYLYSFKKDHKHQINVNGKIYSFDVDEIIKPTLDKDGQFSLYGLKDYYLYKFINGEKIAEPLSMYGVRATPIYISPTGESIHYYKTDDSTYLYRDQELLFKPIPNESWFDIQPPEDFLGFNYISKITQNGNSLFYLEFDKLGYLVFNGKFSNPIPTIKHKSFNNKIQPGVIIAGDFNDKGFFTIQKIKDTKYLLIINNEIYIELDDIDYIFENNYFFDQNELIFYGVKGLSCYQFVLSL